MTSISKIGGAVLALACGMGVVRAQTTDRLRVDPSDTIVSVNGCGRATGYAEANKIVTWQGKTHVSWLDSEDAGFQVRIKTYDHETGEWSETVTIGEADDNHGGPALTIDQRGFLHVVYFPHHKPLRYRRSLAPNDATAWTEVEEVGARTTYPTLVCGADGTLYLSCRESRPDGPWEARLYTRSPSGGWSKGRTLLRSEHTGYSHFQEALAFGPDHRTLHLSCRIYSGKPARGHTVGYLRSDDLGVTWRRASGAEVTLPATAETIDVIAQARTGEGVGLRCGSLAVDARGRPYLLYCSYDSRPPRTWLAWTDDRGQWLERELTAPGAEAGYGLILPGGLVFDGAGRLCAALTRMRPEPSSEESMWGHPTSEIVWLEWDDLESPPKARVLTPEPSDGPRWLPSLERPTGHNRVARPSLLYTEGGRGEGLSDVLSNRVHWVVPMR